jgi:hypothetical protein
MSQFSLKNLTHIKLDFLLLQKERTAHLSSKKSLNLSPDIFKSTAKGLTSKSSKERFSS